MMKSVLFALAVAVAPTTACAQRNPSLIPKLEKLAAAGDASATYFLGMAYQTGSGVDVDHSKALVLFQEAAAAGDPLANYKLGCFYAGQDAVLPPDEDKALAHKLIAAEAGYALAQGDVAGIYARRGNSEKARDWIAKAAAQGTSDALFGYASIHNGRNGLVRDGGVVVAYFTLFLQRQQATPEQNNWLTAQRDELTGAERTRADAIVSNYRPSPTKLTIIALSGERAAEALLTNTR